MRTTSEAIDADTCGVCLAKPPWIGRTRAAVAYGDLTPGLAIQLKYGRKVAIARTMAKSMAPLVQGSDREPVLIPIPLHRSRFWSRGFNQSALVARELSRRLDLPWKTMALRRLKRTPPLKGMSPQDSHSDRRRADHRQYGRNMRSGVATCRCGAC